MEIPEKWTEWLFENKDRLLHAVSKLDIKENLEVHITFSRLCWYIESLELIKTKEI